MSPSSSSRQEEKPSSSEDGASRRSLPRRIWLAVLLPLWVVCGYFLAQFFIIAASKLLPLAGISLEAINISVLNTTFAALAYSLSLFIVIGVSNVIEKYRTTRADLGLHRLPEWQDILLALAGFVVYVLLSGMLIVLAIKLIPGFDADEVQETGFDNLTQRYEYILAFITLVVVAPIAEEILMRGYLYGRLRRIIPVVVAMVVTAALFAVLHLQWNVAVDVFALSLVLTTLREVTGSIWASILVHMMKNGLAFYLLFINTTLSHTIGEYYASF